MKIPFLSRFSVRQLAIFGGGGAFIITAVIIVLSVTVFRGPETAKVPSASWAEHIKAHTSGTISKASSIRVVFTRDIVSEQEVGTDATKIFSFDPGIKGTAEWSAVDEIIFVPEKQLPPGREYTVTLDLSDHIRTDTDIGDFFFRFSIIQPDFDINFTGFRFPELSDLNKQEFHGTLNTSDIADDETVEKILSADQKGRKLTIAWKHDVENNTHHFIIQGIKRGAEASVLTLAWDGSPLDVDKKGEREIESHPRGAFEVSHSRVIFSDEQYIELTFTDPLKQNQNLRGLVYLENEESRTQIDMNVVRIYPQEKIRGNVTLHVEEGVQNSEGKRLSRAYMNTLAFKRIDPGVRFVGKGTILPDMDRLTVPFEAVNVHSVQVTALRVYSDNMGQFFQVNDYTGSDQIRRVGRYLWRKTIQLNATPDESSQWTRYNLDVTELYKKNPNSLFRIELSINRSNSLLPCEGNTDPVVTEPDFENLEGSPRPAEASFWDYFENQSSQSDWANRKNPCHDAYYNPRYDNPVFSARNFVSSNIGVIAKYGSGNTIRVVTADILSARPLSAHVYIYNYQNRLLGKGQTDGNGFGNITLKDEGKPFYLIAETGDGRGYLKLGGDSALPVSHFDVGGETVQDGVKGFIYGERGVWRPGDPIHLTFVLEDRDDRIPDSHPIQIMLYDPQGQLTETTTNYRRVNGFYSFTLQTDDEAPTGTWTARVKLGGFSFAKTLKIETIVPNRLKVNLDLGKKELHRSNLPITATLESEWLHGATAENLETDVSVTLTQRTTGFDRYSDYSFDDVTRTVSTDKTEIFSGQLDENGRVSFSITPPDSGNPPGSLDAHFITRVHEPGGGFSMETQSAAYHPYETYVGIKTPKGDEARGMLLTDTEHEVSIATVDSHGRPVSRNNISITLYKISWKWWWDKSGESLANFTSSSDTRQLAHATVSTRNGMGSWKFQVKYPEWGRYLIRVEDRSGGHAATKIVYMDWPGWAGRAREEKGVGATRLSLTADKERYAVGETATVFLPESQEGNALVSIENGRGILEQRWVRPEKGKNRISIPIREGMSPNVYVHVSLIQPHQDRDNDGPLRLYGIIPLMVDDPRVVLEPVLNAPEEIKPGQENTISVREKNGRKMTYTVAIVDEGLLGLTRFQTPDLKGYFYQKEMLGVTSWDMYDDVVGAYGGELNRILALGGGAGGVDPGQLTESRFPPIVRFLGPFELDARGRNNHTFTLDPYIGSVRVMVVAGEDGAYGKTEKNVFVRQPLMISAMLPRVIGPNEEMNIPVTIFTKRDSIRTVSLSIDGGTEVTFPGGRSQNVRFSRQGSKVVFFRARTGTLAGTTSLTIRATGGGEADEQTVHMDIRSPNPPKTAVSSTVLEPGKSWTHTVMPVGIENTNNARIELSTLPPIHLDRRLEYLIRYPHGCLEQTVSSAFPQLYLGNLSELTETQKKNIEHNIDEAINKIRSFRTSSGAFTFWPGRHDLVNDWVDVYTGHFLMEADEKGYASSSVLLSSWVNRQKRVANTWRQRNNHSAMIQAYRLYVLSRMNAASSGAMNRLRESGSLDPVAGFLLAAAYHNAGQRDNARRMAAGTSLTVADYSEPGYTFGSRLRDSSLILMALTDLDQRARGKEIADRVSEELSSNRWLSTQSTSFALLAMAGFAGNDDASYNFSYNIKIGGRSQDGSSSVAFATHELEKVPDGGIPVEVTNKNRNAPLFVTVTSKGSPAPGDEESHQRGLALSAAYEDFSGNDLDVTSIPQGRDFKIHVTVKNTYGRRLENIALTHIVPSGWQLHNTRLESGSGSADAEYQDFRDDRVYTYFSLAHDQSRTFTVMCNASFAGRYYMPQIAVEDMYTGEVHATTDGAWVTIEPQN